MHRAMPGIRPGGAGNRRRVPDSRNLATAKTGEKVRAKQSAFAL
jgi:hypothetical protein